MECKTCFQDKGLVIKFAHKSSLTRHIQQFHAPQKQKITVIRKELSQAIEKAVAESPELNKMRDDLVKSQKTVEVTADMLQLYTRTLQTQLAELQETIYSVTLLSEWINKTHKVVVVAPKDLL